MLLIYIHTHTHNVWEPENGGEGGTKFRGRDMRLQYTNYFYSTYFMTTPLPHPHLEYEIKRDDDRVQKVFQDPTGVHLLVCMKSRECYYIGKASRKPQPRLLPKVKGQVIESVAWNKLDMREPGGGTGAILLGTKNGSYHTLVGCGGESSENVSFLEHLFVMSCIKKKMFLFIYLYIYLFIHLFIYFLLLLFFGV